jgi:IclR family mhp operon transcriptional activator
MNAHLRALSWPSDLATPDSGFMIVRESTHRSSMLSQHRATIGFRIPMLVSSLGRAWLAYCSDEEREATMAVLRARADDIGEMARDERLVKKILNETRKRGYGTNTGEWLREASVTAIGFPILDGHRALGAINLVLVRDLVPPKEIRSRYVPLLRALANQISQEITQRSSGRLVSGPASARADIRQPAPLAHGRVVRTNRS